MELVAVGFYVVNGFMCFWAIDIVFKEDNKWFFIHAITAFTLSALYVIWYYGDGWITEGLVFLTGATLLHLYQTSNRKSQGSILSDKSKFLTYSLGATLVITIVIRFTL